MIGVLILFLRKNKKDYSSSPTDTLSLGMYPSFLRASMNRIDGKRKIADFMVKEKQPYEFKVRYATIRAREFVRECDMRDLNYGGLEEEYQKWKESYLKA